MQYRYLLAVFIILASAGFGLMPTQPQSVQAQPRITNTTIPVVIPSTAPTEAPQSNNTFVEASPSPTFTPTQPLPDARLRSIAATGTGLIRDFPEDGTVLGVLQDNTDYQVLGQYFSWYQIQLSTAPNGKAWVYFEDVVLSGNLSEIPAIDPSIQPVELSPQDIATATAIVLLQTPSFAQTATAESRILEIPLNTTSQVSSGDTRLPTYTPPADINPTNIPNAQPTAALNDDLVESTITSIASGNIPPVLPILGLAVLGLLGLMIASIRGQ
ncbi:MAG: hypothetical protein WBC91_25480 [Phototrophicaceae bacterium]